MQDGLGRALAPKSIALVGIPRGAKSGRVFLQGILEQGFTGPIYPIHPSADEIDGLKAYKSLLHVPDFVDMVIIMSPKETVFDVLRDCARKRVKSVVLYTSGFSELGDADGRIEEQRMRHLAREAGFRLIGPNCMGVYSPISKLACFPDLPITPGKLGFISQSGSLMNLFVRACAAEGVFISHAVSCGNSADVGIPELLTWLAQDDHTDVICSYCEGVAQPRDLMDALRETVSRKPLVLWKVGLTGAGSRAAASHTGAMTGEGALWKSLFRQFHVLDVYDVEEMTDLTKAFYHLGPHWTAGRMVILSGPGGPAVAAADAVERNGLTMAVLQEGTISRLKAVLPPTGTSPTNPVDVGLSGSLTPSLYQKAFHAVLDDPNVDAVLSLVAGRTAETRADYVQSVLEAHRETDKHIIVIAYPGSFQLGQDDGLMPLRQNGIPVYTTPERALRAYARMVGYYRYRMG